MTATEINNEFLLAYDKLMGPSAPGLDAYEISVLLTKGAERKIKQVYNPLGNKYQEGYEQSEKRKKELAPLTKTANLTPKTYDSSLNLPNGRFVDLPEDFMWATTEEVTVSSADACIDNTRIEVKPITHDGYNKNKRNPFKKPSDKLVWRMDYGWDNTTQQHELIEADSYDITKYHLRYIKRPKPIIVSDLTILPGSLSIEGYSTVQAIEYNDVFIREIIDEAVLIGLEVFQEQRLQTAAQLNQQKTE